MVTSTTVDGGLTCFFQCGEVTTHGLYQSHRNGAQRSAPLTRLMRRQQALQFRHGVLLRT